MGGPYRRKAARRRNIKTPGHGGYNEHRLKLMKSLEKNGRPIAELAARYIESLLREEFV